MINDILGGVFLRAKFQFLELDKFEFDGGKVNGKIVDRCRKDYD